MDTALRLLAIAALVGFSLFRLVRYFRYGMAKRTTAVPPSAGMLMPSAGTPPVQTDAQPATTPVAPDSGSARLLGGLTTAIAWLAINGVMWAALLGLPMLADVPLIWRLFVGVFANFYLFPFARGLGERLQKHLRVQSAPVDDPFRN